MSELAAAVSRAARTARLHELAADWSPELAAKLTQRMPGESVAEAVAGLDSPAPMFAALAPHVAPESLVRAARTVRRPRARASSLGALLGVALECLPEVLALARQFDGSERVFALVDGFPHLSAKLQATVLPELGPGLARAGYAAQRIARGVRPEAFRVAWDVFASAHPTDVTSASILTAAAPPHERAALRASLIHRVVAGGDLAYSAIGELLPHASGSDRTALVERSFEYPGRYGASTIARALGDAIVEPAIEARYLAFLDAGTQDYPWDLACAYADVAARDTPNRAHCIARATAFLDRMLDASIAGANPSPMMAEAGRIPTALEHQVNALLAVANALLQGEPRAHREQQVIEWLRRMCPEHSREDLVPIAWVRTTRLAPELHGAVLEAVSTIEEDAAAFDALAQIMAAAPPLEAAALDLVVARIERHAFPGLPSAPQVAAPPIAMVPSGRARRIATPEEIERALSSRMVAWRIVEVARLASEAAATALPAIEDPIVALVANILLLDAPAEGASAKLAALREDRKGWERYCRAAIALAPRLGTADRIASIETVLGFVVDTYPLLDVRPLVAGLADDAWPAIAALVPRAADSALPTAVIAAALASVPAGHAEGLIRAVLASAPRVPVPELCEAIRTHGLLERLRSDLVRFISHRVWSSMDELGQAIASIATLVSADEYAALEAAMSRTI